VKICDNVLTDAMYLADSTIYATHLIINLFWIQVDIKVNTLKITPFTVFRETLKMF